MRSPEKNEDQVGEKLTLVSAEKLTLVSAEKMALGKGETKES